jgi:hypothetical protein
MRRQKHRSIAREFWLQGWLGTWWLATAEASVLIGEWLRRECCGVPCGVGVAVDELAAFMGIEGDCEDCADELAGSEGSDAIVVRDAGVLFTAGCSFARLRGPISAGAK